MQHYIDVTMEPKAKLFLNADYYNTFIFTIHKLQLENN